MHDGACNAACAEGEQDVPPAKKQPRRRHKLDIPEAHGAALDEMARNPRDEEKETAHADKSDEAAKPRLSVENKVHHPREQDHEITAVRDFKRSEIDDGQNQQRGKGRAAAKARNRYVIPQENQHPADPVQELDKRILHRDFCFAVAAASPKEQPGKQRNQVVPGEPVSAAHAVGVLLHDVLVLRQPEDAHIEKAPDRHAE